MGRNRASDSSAAAHSTRQPPSAAPDSPTDSSADLPMPGSPSSHSAWPCPGAHLHDHPGYPGHLDAAANQVRFVGQHPYEQTPVPTAMS